MSETTQTQLPTWAKGAGWMAADLADGWRLCGSGAEVGFVFPADADGRILEVSADEGWQVWIDSGELICVVTATSPAAARQCALDIVAAIKRAREVQG